MYTGLPMYMGLLDRQSVRYLFRKYKKSLIYLRTTSPTVAAGVMEDPRAMLPRINELLEAVTKK